ncbi:hypothetical protein ABE493_07735 [Stenotrophomonas terrae]|uniref:hypothetical protein n=1 Tax=Stenotrophomonas terrae TaxID=405446 RepID=UPI00320893AD
MSTLSLQVPGIGSAEISVTDNRIVVFFSGPEERANHVSFVGDAANCYQFVAGEIIIDGLYLKLPLEQLRQLTDYLAANNCSIDTSDMLRRDATEQSK